ncbi:protein unc-13 homolog isoform X1 [Musa acuminata AAA Group]|uniref:protein unc-13 homolog isoform X1 n=1 Tax=Musa acuminata AAA Group TaxID=214697 RepID=UPI0031CF6279
MESSLRLQRYRSDRRKLLEFLVSTNHLRAPALASLDLDTISADYVLECIQSGGDFDPSEASRRYREGLDYPIMINLSSGRFYFLLSRPELSGSPPVRIAPQVEMKTSTSHPSSSAGKLDNLIGKGTGKCQIENAADTSALNLPSQPAKDAKALSLGLPSINAGLSDDDIQQTAYEVLLASFVLSRREADLFQDEKNGKNFRASSEQATNDELGSVTEDCNYSMLEVVRVQLEISEAISALTKKGLRNFTLKMMHKQADVPRITLQLLSAVCSSDFPNERSYVRWQKRQANILEELLLRSISSISVTPANLSNLISNLRNTEEWISTDRLAETLKALRNYASELSSMPGKFGIAHETLYWTESYHFNIKLYERLLSSVFDVLEDGQLLQEAEEILAFLRLTWPILGITEKIHDALFAWVLFVQFVQTGELKLLKLTVVELHKALSCEDGDMMGQYTSSLSCSVVASGGRRVLNLVDSVIFNINMWCCNQLEDYHLHFNQDNCSTFQDLLALACLTGSSFPYECAEIKHVRPMAENLAASKLAHMFVEKSIGAAYRQVLNFLDAENLEKDHSLVMLANKFKAVAEKEYTLFSPVLCQQYPEAGIVAAVLLHQLYGKHLKPFLEVVSHLSESTIKVLAASNSLESYLTYILHSAYGEKKRSPTANYIHPYQIRSFCSPLIVHWVQTQQNNILEWTQRAINIEDWEPLSNQQRQAASIIEVFRIIEEIVDQFFNLNLPMDIIHLRSLLIGIRQSLEAYLLHIINQQVDKSLLYPTPPALTRYEESANPFTKKKPVERLMLEDKTMNQLNDLTLPKLCVKLNTLHYLREQLDTLEDAIKHSWVLLQTDDGQIFDVAKDDLPTSSGTVEELFTIFDDIRRRAVCASDMIVDFVGARAIFWDLRNSMIFSLYQGSVENARFEIFIPMLDEVLDTVCDLIVDSLRDQVVSSIFEATMDGYIWVMLDGGPARVFSESDATMMQQDLNDLKDLFVANGQGLPQDVVEKEARLGEEILDLYAMKAETIIDMLISASQQIPNHLEIKKPGRRSATDVDTLLRVLCHKKDKYASKFLKIQYQLPKSSDYEDTTGKVPPAKNPLLSDMLRRKSSINWTKKGQRSFKIVKNKFQEATSEIGRPPR